MDDEQNQARIKARIAGRVSANELYAGFLSAVSADYPQHGADFAEGFIETMATLLPQRRAATVEPERPQPIARLGATILPFGKYNGQSFNDVPLEYLDWLCSSQEEFYRGLRAYLKHPDLESRRGH